MLIDRKSAALSDCWKQLVECAELGEELDDAAGQLNVAHNKIQHFLAPLQTLDAAIDASDLTAVQVARDELRSAYANADQFFFEQARDIVRSVRALKGALAATRYSVNCMTAEPNGSVSMKELDVFVDGVSAGVALAAAPPGTQFDYRGVTLDISKPP